MAQGNVYKPRYTLAYLAKSKIWPYKDSYLRRFYALRARRVQRRGLFSRCVLVATTRNWTIARRFIRPFSRRVGSKTAAGVGGKTAYGRPAKRRYRNSFYIKQQLRFFHGKRKESTFRYLFDQYKNTVGNRTNSFFSSLESRLDMFFFRRRLLPTIYSCHQFIHHHGLIVNGNLETSPRAVIRIGDRVALPIKSWKSLYWNLFCRVYYRRWGLYVYRRRQYTQLKKKIYSLQSRRFRSFFRILTTRYPLATSVAKFKKAFFYKIVKKDSNINLFIKSKSSRNTYTTSGFSFFGKKLKTGLRFSSVKSISSKTVIPVFPSQRKSLFEEFRKFNFKSVVENPLFWFTHKSFSQSFFCQRQLKTRKTLSPLFKARDSFKMFYMFMNRLLSTGSAENGVSHPRAQRLSFKKRHTLQKIVYALRLQKSLLPSVTRIRKAQYSQTFKKIANQKNYKQRSNFYNPFVRNLFMRFRRKRRKKTIRRRKLVRLKTVHFAVPSYLHRDFRTLRAIKINSPTLEDTFYTFRGSLAKVYSFYSARGF